MKKLTMKKSLIFASFVAVGLTSLVVTVEKKTKRPVLAYQDNVYEFVNGDNKFIRTGTMIDVVVKYKLTGEVELLKVEESEFHQMMEDPQYEYVEPDIATNIPTPESMPNMSFETRMITENASGKVWTSNYPYNDPWISSQTYFFSKDDTSNQTMEFFAAKEKSENNYTVRVGIIDDSFMPSPDLVYSEGANFHNGNGDSRGSEYMASQTEIDDCLTWHGPAVAQMSIGISDNGEDGAGGVDNIEFIAAKVLRCGNGSLFSASLAIKWMAGVNVGYGIAPISKKVDVMNLSLGGAIGRCPSYMQSAIDQAVEQGILVVVSAGNNNNGVEEEGFAPATCDNVLVVGSVDKTGNKSIFSNYDSKVDVMAVGEGIIGPHHNYHLYGNSKNWNGTSMASPMVAAAYALLKQTYPDMTAEEGEEIIKASATPISNTSSSSSQTCGINDCGAGILNADRMMRMAALLRNETKINFNSPLGSLSPCDQEVIVANSNVPELICNTFIITMEDTAGEDKAIVSVPTGGDLKSGTVIVQTSDESVRVSYIDTVENDYGLMFCDDNSCVTGIVVPIDENDAIVPESCN